MSRCIRLAAVAVITAVCAAAGHGAALQPKMIADMEGEKTYSVSDTEWVITKPNVRITAETASQGKRSLRFEHTAKGKDRPAVVFQVPDGAKGYSAIVFDVYCERDNGASLVVNLRLRTAKGKAARYKGIIQNMSQFIDGWTTVRLARHGALAFRQQGGVEADWGKICTVGIECVQKAAGTTVFYLDNIRFEGAGKTAAEDTRNMLYNSSFEIVTNPTVPDGWSRDYQQYPYGPKMWGIDKTTAYHGRQCLRIGTQGNWTQSWARHTYIVKGKDYTFSVYLKSSKDDTSVKLSAPYFIEENVKVGRTWQRVATTGKADRTCSRVRVTLNSDAVLWVDAAQFELGTSPTAYAPSVADSTPVDMPVEKKGRLGKPGTALSGICHPRPMFELDGTELDFYTSEDKARARCWIRVSKERCQASKLSWWLERRGQAITRPADLRPGPGVNEWTIPIASLANGEYVLKASFVEQGRAAVEKGRPFRKLPPARHEVRINQWGRFLVCDGKPLFWYGFYLNFPRPAAPAGLKAFSNVLGDMRKANCTSGLVFVAAQDGLDKAGWALDQAQARGMKLWIHLQWPFNYWIPKYNYRTDRYKSREEALAAVRKVVNENKEHPALLGWCTLDEPGNRPKIHTPAYLSECHQLVKQADPHHPCIISHLQRPGEAKAYGGATDLAIMPFEAASKGSDRVYREFWDAGLPMATNSPCFGALAGRVREPTPSEQRVRMYKSIIYGSRGICTYPYRTISPATWEEFGRVGKEIQALTPALLTADDQLRVEVTQTGAGVYGVLKAHKGKYYLITVNVPNSPARATFRLPDIPNLGKVTPMFDTRAVPRVARAKKALTVAMPAQSTAIYRIEP